MSQTQTTRRERKITQVMFTWSWGGFHLVFDDGSSQNASVREVTDMVGTGDEYDRLMQTAARLYGHHQQVNPPMEVRA